MTLDADELNETDAGIVAMLAEGRCTPGYIASELDLQQPYVNHRLKRLVEHGHVDRIDRGLYELVDDPRASTERSSSSKTGAATGDTGSLGGVSAGKPADEQERLDGTRPDVTDLTTNSPFGDYLKDVVDRAVPDETEPARRQQMILAGVAAIELLREASRPLATADFVELYAEYPVDGQPAPGDAERPAMEPYWTETLKPALEAAADSGFVTRRSESSDWVWVWTAFRGTSS